MPRNCGCSRRDFLARGLYGIGVGAGLPLILSRTSAALTAEGLRGTSVETHPERILVVDLGTSQSLAVRSGRHSPLVFDDPARFRRDGTDAEKQVLAGLSRPAATSNETLGFLKATAENATESSDFVRQATASYRSSV